MSWERVSSKFEPVSESASVSVSEDQDDGESSSSLQRMRARALEGVSGVERVCFEAWRGSFSDITFESCLSTAPGQRKLARAARGSRQYGLGERYSVNGAWQYR